MGEWQQPPSAVVRPREDPKDAAAALQPAERTPAPGIAAATRRRPALLRPRQRRPSR